MNIAKTVNWFKSRATEASSKGAYPAIIGSVAALANDPKNVVAWTTLATSVAAFIWPDKAATVSRSTANVGH